MLWSASWTHIARGPGSPTGSFPSTDAWGSRRRSGTIRGAKSGTPPTSRPSARASSSRCATMTSGKSMGATPAQSLMPESCSGPWSWQAETARFLFRTSFTSTTGATHSSPELRLRSWRWLRVNSSEFEASPPMLEPIRSRRQSPKRRSERDTLSRGNLERPRLLEKTWTSYRSSKNMVPTSSSTVTRRCTTRS